MFEPSICNILSELPTHFWAFLYLMMFKFELQISCLKSMAKVDASGNRGQRPSITFVATTITTSSQFQNNLGMYVLSYKLLALAGLPPRMGTIRPFLQMANFVFRLPNFVSHALLWQFKRGVGYEIWCTKYEICQLQKRSSQAKFVDRNAQRSWNSRQMRKVVFKVQS